MSSATKRVTTNMSMQHYRDLGSNDDSVRLDAAHALLTELSPDNNPSAETIRYALNRLIRGLASGRESSRIGFSVTLTELLSQLLGPDLNKSLNAELGIDFEVVIDSLVKYTQPPTKAASSEERDHHLGRLFGLQAIIASSIVFEVPDSAHRWLRIVDLLLELARKKTWLREQCGWTIFSALSKASKPLSRAVIDRLIHYDMLRTPEGVALSLKISDLFGSDVISDAWPHADPLHPLNHALLANIVRESSSESDDSENWLDQKNNRGMWNPKPHFVWREIFNIADERSRNSENDGSFHNLWKVLVDENLFASDASDQRKYWGFQLVQQGLLAEINQQVTILSGSNFLRCLINHLSHKDRYLHEAARTMIQSVVNLATDENTTLSTLEVVKIFWRNGTPMFDTVTKTKTTENLIAKTPEKSLKEFSSMLREFLSSPGSEDAKEAERQRQILVDSTASALRQMKIDHESMAVAPLIRIFVDIGYFSQDSKSPKKLQVPFSSATQTVCRDRLFNLLNQSKSKSSLINSTWITLTIHRLTDNLDEGHELSIDFDKKIQKTIDKSLKHLRRMKKKKRKTSEDALARLDAFELLLSVVLLLLLNGDQDALTVIMELSDCYETSFGSKVADELNTSSIVPIVEILLTLISKPSLLLRKTVEYVMPSFAADMNADSLSLFFDVLRTKESIAGQEEAFEAQDEADDDEAMLDVDLSESSLDSDVEVVNGKNIENLSDKTSDDNTEDELEDGDQQSEDGEAAQLDLALAQVLKTSKVEGDANKGDISADDDESSMDDDQMMALDDSLIRIFKERKKVQNKKKGKKEAKDNVINFKRRVLDLIQIYIKHQYVSMQSLDVLLPLCELCRTTTSQELAQRARECVKEFLKASKGKQVTQISDFAKTKGVLESIHREALRESSKVHDSACSTASIWLAKTMVNSNRESVNDVVDVYGETWKKWILVRKCQVQPAFFIEFVNWSVSATKSLGK